MQAARRDLNTPPTGGRQVYDMGLEWAWQIFFSMGVRVGVANFFFGSIDMGVRVGVALGGLWALEWAWHLGGLWALEWAWHWAVCGR